MKINLTSLFMAAALCVTGNFNETAMAQTAQSRTRWENRDSRGTNVFVKTSSGTWEENDHGTRFSFTETSRTSDFVELFDQSRDFYVRLKDQGSCFKNPGNPNWYCSSEGKWVLSRTKWINRDNQGANVFVKTSSGTWEENDHGTRFSFTETSRTSDFVELFDESRDFYVRLKDQGSCFKNPGNPNWYCSSEGKWVE